MRKQKQTIAEHAGQWSVFNSDSTPFAGSKRKRGITMRPSRQPRIPFTSFQQTIFENQFQIDHYLTSEAVRDLASHLELPEQRIKVWFQNRRARERRESQQKADNTATTTTMKIQLNDMNVN